MPYATENSSAEILHENMRACKEQRHAYAVYA